jgi:hypothetical protein
MPKLTIEWYFHNTVIIATTVLVTALMFCIFGSLYEEYLVEGRISKEWIGRFSFWLLWILR